VSAEPTIREVERKAEEQRDQRTRQSIATIPIILFSLFAFLRAIPATRDWATGRDERNPIEIITFLAMAVAGVMAIRLAMRVWRLGHTVFLTAFFVTFGLVAFVVAGDELAWSQVVIDLFREGADAAAASDRGLHEISVLRERTELFRFGFGVIGIGGVSLTDQFRFRFLRVPMELLPWLVVIGAISLIDVTGDVVSLGESFTDFLERVSELTEMMIAIVVVLYIWGRTRDMWFRIP
jgi:hypothetical protein